MNKRGDTSIWIIISLILGMTILVLFLTGFIDIWPEELFNKPTNVDMVATQCSVLCSTNSKYNYCSQEREVVFSAEKTEKSTCFQLSKTYPDYFKGCPSISCSGSSTPPVVTPPVVTPPANGEESILTEMISGQTRNEQALTLVMKEIRDSKGGLSYTYYKNLTDPKSLKYTAGKPCYCATNCESYSKIILNSVKDSSIDPLFVLAMIMQESECKNIEGDGGQSVGLLQVTNCARCSDPQIGIPTGIDILNEKFKEFDEGVKKSWSYLNVASFKSSVDKCISWYPKYGEYITWAAALRGYNGWGCNNPTTPEEPHVIEEEYVEKVFGIYASLRVLYSKCSDGDCDN